MLVQIGGTLNPATDIALKSSGGTAFAENLLPGFAAHSIAHLNDGTYGNSNSWIGSTPSTFCGIAFSQPTTISYLGFGRDNLANDDNGGPYDDRYAGAYVFQYTQVPDPNASTPEADWTSFGSFALDTDATAWGDGSNTYLRHLYQFSPIAGVTGVRLLLDTVNGNNIAIDELEAYGPAPAWTGGASSLLWSDSGNWNGIALGTGSALAFSGSAGLSNTNDLNGFSAVAITFDGTAGAFTLSGNSLTLLGNVTNSSTANQTINLNVALANPTCIFNTGPGSLLVNGVLSGSGGLMAVGPGVLTLANTNTYSGATTITGGTLVVAPNGSLPSGAAVSLNGGQLTLDVAQTFSQLQSANAAEGGTIVLANNVCLTVSTTADNNYFYGYISGSGGLTLAGSARCVCWAG